MSISIYYVASRPEPLSPTEQSVLKSILKKYSVEDQIQKYLDTGDGLDWESFCLYETPPTSGALLEGATKLPDNSDEATWIGMQHWCAMLSELRRKIPSARWHVTVDDHEIAWDSARQVFDPGM